MDGNNAAVDRILAEAACLVRREKEAAGDAEPADGYKEKQINCLKDFATIRGLWIDVHNLPLSFLSKGGENEVFAGDEDFVVKLNNFAYAGDDLTHFFIRIEAHNRFFWQRPLRFDRFCLQWRARVLCGFGTTIRAGQEGSDRAGDPTLHAIAWFCDGLCG